MYDFSIKVMNYKCFKGEAGFDELKRVNLIIGRNNSGKSSIVDVIQAITTKSYAFDSIAHRENQIPEVVFSANLDEATLLKVFRPGVTGGKIGIDHAEYGKLYIGRRIQWAKSAQSGKLTERLIEIDDQGISPQLRSVDSGNLNYLTRLLDAIPIVLEGKTFRNVLAERDIRPEVLSETISITPNGAGLTNTLTNFINRADLPSNLVEQELLNALNEVFAQDANFTDIVCQFTGGTWEIELEELEKGRIALSKSGSGLKTVLMVLVNLILIPYHENRKLENYIFAFEELENNIHPAMLRRLNSYITAVQYSFFLIRFSMWDKGFTF
jgi:putative ATP-dependent endonuclease of the OLD family